VKKESEGGGKVEEVDGWMVEHGTRDVLRWQTLNGIFLFAPATSHELFGRKYDNYVPWAPNKKLHPNQNFKVLRRARKENSKKSQAIATRGVGSVENKGREEEADLLDDSSLF
jgi:hypothetical protein